MVGRGRGWHGHGRGFGGRGGWQQADLPPADDAAGWFAGRLPDGWFTGAPSVTVDRDEILVVGTLEPPTVEGSGDGPDPVAVSAAEAGRISRFREDTREERISIAQEAEHRYGHNVTWGAVAGETRQLFTTLSAPVMPRSEPTGASSAARLWRRCHGGAGCQRASLPYCLRKAR